MAIAPFTEIVLRDVDGIFAIFRRSVMIQVRHGQLTAGALTRIRETIRPMADTGRPFGMLMVVEPGAQVATESVRALQRDLIDELVSHPNVRMAPVNLGDDVASMLNRSVSRLVVAGTPRVRRSDRVDTAIAWLVEELGALGLTLVPREVASALEALRALAASDHP